MADDKLKVKILTPEEVLWEGYARSVSSENEVGPFDILPGHANFFSLVENHPLIIHKEGEDEEFNFEDPILIHVEDDEVSIYANVGSSVIGAEAHD